MASRVALDLPYWAMRSAPYRLIRMAIEMASKSAAFISVVDYLSCIIVVKDRFDQHLPRGKKAGGTKPTKKPSLKMVVLFCLFVWEARGDKAHRRKKRDFNSLTELLAAITAN